MNYTETLQYLLTRLPLFSRIGAAAYKEDLDNTVALCNFLHDPHRSFRCVHVAGTNGKGSVSHMLAAIFQVVGYKTGLYTSPHLRDFRERIRVNGEMIREDFVVKFTEKIQPMIDRIEPSFFEITVAMAFDYFREEAVDIAIIETGLGGRLDSTNVVTPELSVITNIGMDHMNLLGDTLQKIAGEKAGIIKAGIPAVLGETLPETEPVFVERAALLKSPLTIASHEWQATDWNWKDHELHIEVARRDKTDHAHYRLDLPGIYQRKNLCTVLESCRILRQRGWKLEDHSLQSALSMVKKITGLHGRWEVIGQHPLTVLDVAHNVDGIRQLMEQVELTDHYELHLVIGFVKDKDIDSVLALLPPTAKYYFTQASIPRALPAPELAAKASLHLLHGNSFLDVNAALKEARLSARKTDLIVVCGSVFLVGEVNEMA